MEPYVTHAFTFLLGTAVGAAGTYYAEKFTDQRRAREAKRARREAFNELKGMMPSLFAQLQADLAADQTRLIREVVILPQVGVLFNGNKPRFELCAPQFPNLAEQISHLEAAQFVHDVTPGNAPIYRMSEDFVSLLRGKG